MHRLFGKTKTAKETVPPPSLSDASTSLNSRTTEIDAKIKACEEELRKFQTQLKKATGSTATTLKKRAMDVLKRKKMYEQQRDQLAGQAFNIDQTSFAIETIKTTQVTVAAMKEANKQLKIENKKINLNEIEDMQDDLEDQLEDAGEIGDILSRSYGVGDDIDEDELDAELAGLGDELEAIGNDDEIQSSVDLPQQPTSSISNISAAPNSSKVPLNEFGLPI